MDYQNYLVVVSDGANRWTLKLAGYSVSDVADTIERLFAHGHTISGMVGGVCADNCGDILDDMPDGPDKVKAQHIMDRVHEADIALLAGDEDIDQEGDYYIDRISIA